MTIRISVRFNGSQRTCGWTETLFFPGSNLGSASDYMQDYYPLRLAVAPSTVTIVGGRAAVIGQAKHMKVLTQPVANEGTFNAEEDMTEPWSALLIQLSIQDLIRVTRFMHGLPQTQVTGGNYTPTAPFTTALNALLASIRDNTGLYCKDPQDPQGGKQFFDPTSALPLRLTVHQIGRPFDLLVGRRLA